MKKILLIALLLIPFIGFSQTTKPIDGFLGIKFGTPRAAVIAAIRAKGGKLSKESTADVLAFTDVRLGQRETDLFFVRLVNNKVYRAEFTFKPADDYHAIEYYNNLVTDLNGVYGKGESTKKFTSSFKDGDGHEVGALLIGAAEFYTVWESSTNKNLINASIDKDDDGTSLVVTLMYEDSALAELESSQEKKQDKSDF